MKGQAQAATIPRLREEIGKGSKSVVLDRRSFVVPRRDGWIVSGLQKRRCCWTQAVAGPGYEGPPYSVVFLRIHDGVPRTQVKCEQSP